MDTSRMHLKSTSTKSRLYLLKQLPLFAQLSDTELEELASYFHDVVYSAKQVIVLENEAIDSVFIIVKGQVEVSRDMVVDKQLKKEALSVLYEGESIGLSEMGFFSTTDERTATVTALTPVFLIRLALMDFKHFIEKYPDCIANMEKSIDRVMRQQLIKKVEPFAKINRKLLEKVAENIEEQYVTSGTFIFRQEDHADCCYLVRSGRINILLDKSDGSQKVLAELGPGELFGELALLTENKRNATVKAITPCKLYVLKKPDFDQLLQGSSDAYEAITNMMMDRHRPLKCEGIKVHIREDAEKNTHVILKNGDKGTYFQTSQGGLFVWNLLDGEHTLREIAIQFFYKFRTLASDDIGYLVVRLMESGFVKVPRLTSYVERPKLPWRTRALMAISKVLQYEYSLKNVDAWVTSLYKRVGYLFFTKPAKIIMASLAIIGFFAFLMFLNQVGGILKTIPNIWLLFILLIPANILIVPLHELAHALTTKSYGHQVHRFGIGWFWIGPIAFADTSDMWLSTRGPRLAVDIAGIYLNIVISGIYALLAWIIPSPTVSVFLWLMALSSYLMAMYNLDPIIELDGYYVLMDALDKPNLRTHAVQWLMSDFKKTFSSPKLIRQYLPEILYWLSCLLFIILAAVTAYILQTFIFNNILPEKIGGYPISNFKFVLVSLAIFFSFASIYAKIKKETRVK